MEVTLTFIPRVPPNETFLKLIFREGERKKQREKHRFVVPLIYAFIGWFLYVPWFGIEPTTLAYRDDALTNWATWPGSKWEFSHSYIRALHRVTEPHGVGRKHWTGLNISPSWPNNWSSKSGHSSVLLIVMWGQWWWKRPAQTQWGEWAPSIHPTIKLWGLILHV